MKEKHRKNKIVFDAEPSMRSIDSNGYMHVKLTPISKACVNPYLGREIPGYEEQGLKPDEIYYALRDPDEIKKAVGTFNGLPLLLDHHDIDAEHPDKEHQVGSTGTDAVFDGTYLMNSLSITDADAIRAIEDGTAREISCAYSYEPDFTPGEFEGVPYDFVIREIKGNHVALVEEGRAGHDVKVADSIQKVKEKLEMPKRMNEEKKKNLGKAKDAALEENEVITPAPGEDEEPEGVAAPETPAEDDGEEVTAEDEEVETTAEDDDEETPAEDEEPEEINKDSADYKAGFADGIKAGQETGGEKEVSAVASDSLKRVKDQAKKEALAHVRELSKAARACEFIIGRQDALAFDSATDIYELALKQKGFNTKQFPKSAYASMVTVLRKQDKKAIAHDSKIIYDEELPAAYKALLD